MICIHISQIDKCFIFFYISYPLLLVYLSLKVMEVNLVSKGNGSRIIPSKYAVLWFDHHGLQRCRIFLALFSYFCSIKYALAVYNRLCLWRHKSL
ncbi:hypothetical protein DFS33DRAFT_237912 [Desarmillaria ectypa]|nr:hypothetical protein DFS33DRAFT_237912 [Desarmillaria ectypa]